MTHEPDQTRPASTAPVTGHEEIDLALASLELGDDVHSHHDQIAAVLEVLQTALHEQAPKIR